MLFRARSMCSFEFRVICLISFSMKPELSVAPFVSVFACPFLRHRSSEQVKGPERGDFGLYFWFHIFTILWIYFF